ncbi:MAG: hypothetical protein M0R74_11745 [Dehalococcoidia bacterium]|nr:hypothetical protein [Dehalococcoidia bacterium]
MGYTHYYYTTTFTKKSWKLILNDVAQHHAPKSIRVSSDGGPEDWQEAEEFVKNTLGYEEKFREEED